MAIRLNRNRLLTNGCIDQPHLWVVARYCRSFNCYIDLFWAAECLAESQVSVVKDRLGQLRMLPLNWPPFK